MVTDTTTDSSKTPPCQIPDGRNGARLWTSFDRIIPERRSFFTYRMPAIHNRGAHFTNLHKEIDEDLLKVF